MNKIKRVDSGSRMSQVVIHKDQLITAGLVAGDPNTDVAGQTGQILDKIDNYLADEGINKQNIMTATIWLSDISDYSEMNLVWDAWVSKENPPVRACVESRLAAPEYKVEIQISAAI